MTRSELVRPARWSKDSASSTGTPRSARFKVERVRGLDGAWHRVIHGKEIRIETVGNDVRNQHGPLNFKILNVPEFDGSYSYYTFEIRTTDFKAFHSPKGLTVQYQRQYHHFHPNDLPTDYLIVIEHCQRHPESPV